VNFFGSLHFFNTGAQVIDKSYVHSDKALEVFHRCAKIDNVSLPLFICSASWSVVVERRIAAIMRPG
jgi:hypothetical protein